MKPRNLVLTKKVVTTYEVRTEGGQQLGTFEEGESWRNMLELVNGPDRSTIIVDKPNNTLQGILDRMLNNEQQTVTVPLVKMSLGLCEKLVCTVCKGRGTSPSGEVPCSNCNGTGETP